ncbi:hypothetical protein GCM10027055_01370 [Janibacter alkaliphilus]
MPTATRRAAALSTLALSAPVLLAACGTSGPAEPAGTITVTATDWSGWRTPSPSPPTSGTASSASTPDGPTEVELPASEGASVDVETLTGELTITVTDVDDDEVELETSQGMSLKGEGGISLTDVPDEFTLAAGETLALSTPTMDAGTTVELTWEQPGATS